MKARRSRRWISGLLVLMLLVSHLNMMASGGEIVISKSQIVVTIGADLSRIGFRGSPTKVVKIFPPPTRTGGRKTVWNGNAAELADTVKEAING